jgi:hypothetical protein
MSENKASDNKTLLVIIAVFCAITAFGTIVGLSVWAYSWWQAKQVVDRLTQPADDGGRIATGLWRGTFEYPGGQRVDMKFRVRQSSPVSGTMTFESPTAGRDACEVSVSEASKASSTVTLTTKATVGPADCAKAGRWEISVKPSALTGKLVWSSSNSLVGSRLVLTQP